MKKILLAMVAAFFTLTAAETELFTGSWCVQDEGITLTFFAADSVRFSSEDDETISGAGTFQFDDSTLTATIDNEGMIMEVSYGYKVVDEKVSVVTNYVKVNGDAMEASDETMIMVRCNDSETSVPVESVAVNSKENIEEEK